MDLKIGDVVRLNSGSAAMTVEAIAGTSVTCIWMTSGILRRDKFERVLLTKITGIADPAK